MRFDERRGYGQAESPVFGDWIYHRVDGDHLGELSWWSQGGGDIDWGAVEPLIEWDLEQDDASPIVVAAERFTKRIGLYHKVHIERERIERTYYPSADVAVEAQPDDDDYENDPVLLRGPRNEPDEDFEDWDPLEAQL